MRMWMIDPKLLCKQHLLGEHNEIHKHKHIFVKKRKIDGYIKNNYIEPKAMKTRHDELVKEMIQRGYKHQSEYEMPDIDYLPDLHKSYLVDKVKSMDLLYNRCEECRKMISSIKISTKED